MWLIAMSTTVFPQKESCLHGIQIQFAAVARAKAKSTGSCEEISCINKNRISIYLTYLRKELKIG